MEKKKFKVVIKSRKTYTVEAVNSKEALEIIKSTDDIKLEYHSKTNSPICYRIK